MDFIHLKLIKNHIKYLKTSLEQIVYLKGLNPSPARIWCCKPQTQQMQSLNYSSGAVAKYYRIYGLPRRTKK